MNREGPLRNSGRPRGRRHRVITAVAVRRGDRIWEREVVTAVKMKRLSDVELNAYLASGDWRARRAPTRSRDPRARFIPWIQGSYSAVMGLPVAETAQLLAAAGYPVHGGAS
jgi:septum formation protein